MIDLALLTAVGGFSMIGLLEWQARKGTRHRLFLRRQKSACLYRAANIFQDCLQGFALVTLLVVVVITPLSKAVLGRVTESVHTTVVSDG